MRSRSVHPFCRSAHWSLCPGRRRPVQTPDVTTSSLPDGGVVRLHLGPSDFFRFDAPNGSGGYTPGTPAPISVAQCAATTSGVMAIQVGPANGRLGLVADGLGVRVGGEGQGQPCGQVNGTGQSLSLTLSGPLAGTFMDRAELDIEGKFDATVRGELPPRIRAGRCRDARHGRLVRLGTRLRNRRQLPMGDPGARRSSLVVRPPATASRSVHAERRLLARRWGGGHGAGARRARRDAGHERLAVPPRGGRRGPRLWRPGVDRWRR